MTDNVQSAMLEILKRIQTDVSDVKHRLATVETDVSETKVRVVRLEDRLVRVEDTVGKQRRDTAAMLVMMRGTVGVFDERMGI